jgi:SAM-dependent methyltransferase
VRIIDLGGTCAYWDQRGWGGRQDVEVTALNLRPDHQTHPNVEPAVGDVTDLPYDSLSFDIAFSNSVIEHLFTFEAQRKMAREVSRVAALYWVQTPNFWFPVEPHFLTVGWHWLPREARVRLLQRRGFGWYERVPERERAERYVDEFRILRPSELRDLFPDARIEREKVGPLTKSLIAIR